MNNYSSMCSLCVCVYVCVKLSLCLFLCFSLPHCSGVNDYFMKILHFESDQSTDRQGGRQRDCTTKHGSMWRETEYSSLCSLNKQSTLFHRQTIRGYMQIQTRPDDHHHGADNGAVDNDDGNRKNVYFERWRSRGHHINTQSSGIHTAISYILVGKKKPKSAAT